MALTQEALLSFLLERGGKVRNSELLNNFRSQINCSDPAEKQHNRDLFKKLVNSVAVVKQIDEAKFVVVKKRYQDFTRDGTRNAHMEEEEDSFSSQGTSFSCTSPPHRAETSRQMYADIENNNVCCSPKKRNGNHCHDVVRKSAGSLHDRRPLSRHISSEDTTAVKILNISADQANRARKSGAVFAVIAVKSPPRDPAPVTQHGSLPQVPQRHKTTDKPIKLKTKASSVPDCRKDTLIDSKCWVKKQAGAVEPAGFPQVRPPKQTTRQGDDAKYSESVPLEPLAHEWLVKCAAGLWGQIYGLLLQDTRLAHKKDFMSGFTALHWAAKDGNGEMIHKLMEVSRKRGTCINVNSKAHGGYTPLHIAAIHGHTAVMVMLMQRYGANVNERDNNGKKALHYLGKDAPGEVRALLGGEHQSKHHGKTTEDGENREHSKGFNTISKLFQPHTGRKQKTTKSAADW